MRAQSPKTWDVSSSQPTPVHCVAEEPGGAVEERDGGREAAREVVGGAGREGGHPDGVRVADAVRDRLRERDQSRRPSPCAPAPAGGMDRLPSQGQGDPEGLAGPEGEPEAPRLEVRALDDVDDADPDGDGAGGVDAGEDARCHVLGRLRPEAEAAHREDDALLQEQHQGLVRRGGTVEADTREDLAEGRLALVDVAADEELVRGAAIAARDVGAVGPGGGLQVDLRRLEAPAGVGQGVGEPDRGSPGPRGRRGTAVRGRGGRAWRRGRRPGPRPRRRPPPRSSRPAFAGSPGRLEVDGQGLGVGPPGLLQLAGEQAMPGRPSPPARPPRHRLPDAVVIGLDLVGRIRAGAPDQVVRPQQGQRREPVGAQPGGAAGDGLADRPARHGDASRSRRGSPGSSPDAPPEHLVEGRPSRPPRGCR